MKIQTVIFGLTYLVLALGIVLYPNHTYSASTSGVQLMVPGETNSKSLVYAQYAGSESCKNCHQEEYDVWRASNHGLAERLPSTNFDQKAFIPTRSLLEGIERASVRCSGTNFFVTCIGLSHSNETHRVERVIGNNPLRQCLVAFTNGRLQTLEASYDPDRNEWFDVFGNENREPGEWGHWTGRGMNWNSMCAVCHNTRLRKNYDAKTDSYQTSMAERSVGCEACHGPMRAHVAWQDQYGKSGKKDSTVARFTKQQRMDNCGYCHSRRSELTDDFKPGDAFFDRASLAIADATDTYYPDGQIRDEDYEFTAFNGSRMYAAGVYCMDCHNPHSAKTVLPGNTLCLRCHNGSYPKAPIINPVDHSHHKVFDYDATNTVFNLNLTTYNPRTIKETGGECVNCHMPQTVYMQRHWRHDHGFTSPDPLLTKEYGIPNACNRCHADKTTDWALGMTEKWYGDKMNRPARARTEIMAKARNGDSATKDSMISLLATNETDYWKAVAAGFLEPWTDQPGVSEALLQQLRSPSPLVREAAVRALQPAVDANDAAVAGALNGLLQDPVRNVRVAAAWALRQTLETNTPVAAELQQFLNIHADQPPGQAEIGAYELARGDLDAAVTHYVQATSWDSNSAPLHNDLAIVLSMQGKNQEAVKELEAACRLSPQEADYEFKLGLAWAGLKDMDRAAAAIKKATEIDPRHAWAWYNLGLIYQSTGKSVEAIDALQRAEAIAVNDPEIPYARATILAQLGRLAEARTAALRALEINPNYPSAIHLLNMIPAP